MNNFLVLLSVSRLAARISALHGFVSKRLRPNGGTHLIPTRKSYQIIVLNLYQFYFWKHEKKLWRGNWQNSNTHFSKFPFWSVYFFCNLSDSSYASGCDHWHQKCTSTFIILMLNEEHSTRFIKRLTNLETTKSVFLIQILYMVQ